MQKFAGTLICLIFLNSLISLSQENSEINAGNQTLKSEFYGFIRGGMYSGIDHDVNNKPYVSSAFSDLGLKFEMSDNLNFKAFADLRFRYGSEFLVPVNSHDLREAYVRVNGKRWNITAGQTIIKWGRADFTNPTSKLSPQNLISRSPDREDMDMGNLLSNFNWFPSDFFNFEAVIIPYYRSSVLLIDPIPLPENVSINKINSLITNRKMFSYGLKADFHFKGIDGSISWFDGYDPMPGTTLSSFNLDLSGEVPLSITELTFTPYKTRVLGIDFETAAGNVGIRGEASWSLPYLSFKTYEYVPWPEIKWVTGFDWSSGAFRIIGEYSGKNIPHFTPSEVDPVIGTEPDYAQLAALLSTPGFNLEDYVRQQVGAFNRLYNYQLKKYYHTGAIRIEADLINGRLTPSFFTMYNFTSRDLMCIPEMKYKPSDGLTISFGGEYYSGLNSSLYDIIDGFMNSVYISLRVDF